MLGPRRCSSSPWVRPWAEKVRISQAPVLLSSPSLRCVWGAPGPKQRKSSAFRSSLAKHLCTKGGAKKRSKWVPKRAPNHPKIDPGGCLAPLWGASWARLAYLTRFGGQLEDSGARSGGLKGAKRRPKGAQWGAKGSQRRPKREPGARVGRPMGPAARHVGSFGLEYGKPRKTSYFIGSGRLGGVPSGPFLEPQRSFFGQLGAL